MDLLWGNAPAHLARHSLAQALTVLKQKVGREHLLIQRAAVALVEGAVDADVAHLDACDLQIRGAFLDGFDVPASAAFEQWKDEWRAKLTPRIRDCLVKQMDAGRRIGDFARRYDAWVEVRRRTPRIMVVTGDPGVGKTTLTNAFVSTCQMEGAVVARAQAYDAERELPFAILAELIKQLTLQRAIGAADPEALSELSRVSPEIFNVFPGVPMPVEWSAEVIPLRLAAAFLKAVVAATDESAVAARSGGLVGEVPSARIVRAGNGNALALELLTREWVAHGSSSLLSDVEALNTQPVANLGIPRAIGAVFERQVRRLDTATRAALDLAAVLGRRLADLPLYEVVGLTSAGAGEALSRLREEGFLREVHGGLEFRNELIRAEAYYSVAAPARQHLHRQVGEMLVARKREERQPFNLEIAWHFLRGRDPVRALTYALEGADAALHVGAPSESEQVLLALLQQPCAKQHTGRIQVLLARALLDQSKADNAL